MSKQKSNATGRNATSRFVGLPHYLLKSSAWLTMTPNAKALLIEVWRRHNGSNNGEISYAVREASEIGLSSSTAARAFTELVDRGFLRVRRQSRFALKTKEARTWELTAEPCNEKPASKDFMRWSENRIQSHQRDAQCHQRDTRGKNETILPISVPPQGP